MNFILNTGRTVWQGASMELGKDIQYYVDSAAICYMNEEQLNAVGVKVGDSVKISSDYGSVVVKAVLAKEAQPDGMIYVPMGPWANKVIRPTTDSTATPSFKNTPVTLEASDEPVLDMPSLMATYNKVHNF